jgi:Ser/Thr protein kinase RdoA (MazF antagonist)
VGGEYSAEVVEDLKLMVARGLPRWGLAPDARVELLNLSENATFLIERAAGVEGGTSTAGDLILRVHRVGYSSTEEIRSELAWIFALRQAGAVETAQPIAGRDGELVQRLVSPAGRLDRDAVAFERLPGAEPGQDDALPWFERLGQVTAKLHRHARIWRLPAGFRRKRWDLAAMIGPAAYWGPWRAAMGLDAAGIRVFEAALALIERRLDTYGVGPERFGLVHADLRLANLLADGERLCVIDFDDCGFSWFMYDFASGVSFIEDDPKLGALLDAWLEGYRQVAPLAPADAAEIPTFVMLRRILLCAWLASHSEVPLAQQLGIPYTHGTLAIAEEFLGGRYLKGTAAAHASRI